MTTGMCSNPNAPDGTACNSGSMCTMNDTCVGGKCTAGTPVVCAAKDQCHNPGVCDTTTGMCTNPQAPDGMSCDDGDKCTQTDACMGGVCTGSNPKMCAAMDECHTAGMCDPTSGTCSNPTKADGSPCTGGTCMGGACTPTTKGTGGAGAGGGTTTSTTTGTGGSNPVGQKSGCGCGVAGAPTGALPSAALLLLFAARRRARRGAARA
jgi:MYXO-CTERM domain-containing protein